MTSLLLTSGQIEQDQLYRKKCKIDVLPVSITHPVIPLNFQNDIVEPDVWGMKIKQCLIRMDSSLELASYIFTRWPQQTRPRYWSYALLISFSDCLLSVVLKDREWDMLTAIIS